MRERRESNPALGAPPRRTDAPHPLAGRGPQSRGAEPEGLKRTRQFVCSFPDDTVYFCQDIADAYHIVPLGLRSSPSAFFFATSSFGYVGINLPIDLLISTAESPEEVD